MEDVERFDNCFSKLIRSNTKYGFFVSLNMENFKATKNWREFNNKCLKENCFIFERICYNKKDKSYIEDFDELYYNNKEDFSEKNTEFLIFCEKNSIDILIENLEDYAIKGDLNIVPFDYEQRRDLPLYNLED